MIVLKADSSHLVFLTVVRVKESITWDLHGDLQMKCRMMALSASKIGTGIVLTIGLNNIYGQQVEQLVNEFNTKKEYEIKEFKQKRSLDSNSYMWILADKLAGKLRSTKEEIYRIAVSNVGVFTEIKVADAEAAKRFKRIWQHNGVGWLTRTINDTTIQAYYGSSTYNTQEMARLIDFLQDECRRQGIETRPKEEVEAMLREWGER